MSMLKGLLAMSYTRKCLCDSDAVWMHVACISNYHFANGDFTITRLVPEVRLAGLLALVPRLTFPGAGCRSTRKS